MGKYFLLYHMYLIPEEGQLKDAMAFAYDRGLGIATKPDKEGEDEDSAILLEKYDKC